MAENQALSVDEFKMVLPNKMRHSVSDELMAQINTTISDPIIMDTFRDNLLGFASVMKDGRFKMEQYICAVKYVSFKLMGDTNKDAYIKTFPGKYVKFLQDGTSTKDIARYSTAYNKTKLVNLIFEQSLVPTHVVNAPLFQRALNVQADLMLNAKSEKVRSDAASSLLMHLKPPETQKIELDIGVKEDDSIKMLRETTLALVRQQQGMIIDGSASVQAIAHSTIVKDVVEEGEIV